MRYANGSKFSILVGAVLIAGTLVAPGKSQARGMDIRDQSNGGFEIEFDNGCVVSYDRYGDRYGNSNNCKNKQLGRADEAARSHRSSNDSGGSYADAIPEGQMRKYCQGEASARLNVRPNYLSTDDVERMGNRYVVRGEETDSGKTFECTFDKHGVYQGVDVHSSSGYGDGIPEGQMRKYCQGEASAKLDVRPTYLSTDDVQRMGNKYVVRGEETDSGTTFECTFDKHGVFQGVDVRRHDSGYGSNDNDEIPYAAKNKCLETFGNSPKITSISPLRPGYWEVIMQDRHGPRSAACTVTSSGQIQDWVDLH